MLNCVIVYFILFIRTLHSSVYIFRNLRLFKEKNILGKTYLHNLYFFLYTCIFRTFFYFCFIFNADGSQTVNKIIPYAKGQDGYGIRILNFGKRMLTTYFLNSLTNVMNFPFRNPEVQSNILSRYE